MRILLVDDDEDLLELLDFVLRREGFEILTASDNESARRQFSQAHPDLIVLDVYLGIESGLDFLRHIRQTNTVPVIILSARAREDDKVLGLDLGADDYLTKPFSHRELVARVRANLRRQEIDRTAERKAILNLHVGPVTMNLAEHTVTVRGHSVDLTITEFRVLHHLMVNAGTIIPTHSLLKHIWGEDDPSHGDVVRVTVHRLRRKFGDDPSHPQLFHTIPGVGIMLKPVD
jgi:two-component system, OmpR family, response regulator VicR